ncbi:MAG: hypothetical protein B7Z61_14265, partial [Acidobacteria bacterium 37-71-11]
VLHRLPEIVEFSGIGPFLDQPVKTYSSGMYVRLGFAVAVAVEPDVLVVDEILAVGDEAFAHRCLDRIARLQRRGTAILLVSHDLGLVEQLAQRALYLRDGAPVMTAPAGVAVARYRSDVAGEEAGAGEAAGSARRWGNGAVSLDAVELVDGAGRPLRLLASGEPAGVRIAYTVRVPQEDFVFGVAINREDGSHVFGSNTRLRLRGARVHGHGTGGVAGIVRAAPPLDAARPRDEPAARLRAANSRSSTGPASPARYGTGSRATSTRWRPPGTWMPMHAPLAGSTVAGRPSTRARQPLMKLCCTTSRPGPSASTSKRRSCGGPASSRTAPPPAATAPPPPGTTASSPGRKLSAAMIVAAAIMLSA